MRTLTTLFETEKNKKTGAKPVWILKCPFVAKTVYLSDRTVTYLSATELMPYQVDRDFSAGSWWTNTDLAAYDETGDLTITANAINQDCKLDVANAPTTIGKRYRLTFSLANAVGTWRIYDYSGVQLLGTTTSAATQTIDFTAATAGGIMILSNNVNSSGDFDNFSLKEICDTLPWISSWGSIDEDISNELSMPMVSDFSLSIIIDPDADPDIHDLLWSEAVETLNFELYLWFEGLTVATDPMILVWTGNIVDFEKENELIYNVDFVDQSVKYDKHPGDVLSLADYADADLDDVGYQLPIIYGAVEKVPALRLDIGLRTSLKEAITIIQTNFNLTSGTGLAANSIIMIGAEKIKIVAISGANITSCYRGYNSAGSPGKALERLNLPADIYWNMGCVTPSGDVYFASQITGDIYKKSVGTDQFIALAQTGREWTGMAAAPNGNVYASDYGGDIYMQTAGAGNFVALGQTSRYWVGMCAAPNGNIYAAVDAEDIYMQTAGAGNFVTLNQTHRQWWGMAATPGGNIYCSVRNGDIYMRTAGTGDFTALGGTSRDWRGMAAAPNGDVYAVDTDSDIYRQTAGAGTFVALGKVYHSWQGIVCDLNGDIYASTWQTGEEDVYKLPGSAVAHELGESVAEITASVHMFANHPVEAIDTIYAVRPEKPPVDITSICTKYTGQGGANDLAGYAGKAVVSVTLEADLLDSRLLISGDGYIGGAHYPPVHSDVYTKATSTNALPGYPYYATDHTKSLIGTWADTSWASEDFGTTNQRFHIDLGKARVITKIYYENFHSSGVSTTLGAKTFTFWGSNDAASFAELTYGTDTGWTQLTCSQATLDQHSAANAADPKYITVTNTTGYRYYAFKFADNWGGVSKMGVRRIGLYDTALIERPDFIFEHFLYTYAGLEESNFSTDAAASFAADSYVFSVVINTRKKIREWCAYMALQCRCWFRFANSKAYLLYRPDSLSSDKTIAKFADNDDFTTTMKITRSPLDEVINKIRIYYNRDWSMSAGAEAYQAVTTASDATSITAYGEKEDPETFQFDFITVAAMATDLRDFYLARYKDRKKVITGEVFLDQFELEFADAVTLTEAGAIVCEVRKVGMEPGSGNAIDKIILQAREY